MQDVDLFTPIKVGTIQCPNRCVMAPMSRNRSGHEGVPPNMMAAYYAQRASAGLLINEATWITPGGGNPNTPGITNKEQVEGWKRVTDAVHEHDGRIILQLWHVGRISHPSMQPNNKLPVAPSAITPEGEAETYTGNLPYVKPRALSTIEIPHIIELYTRAAERAKKAGFDGVEIHAGNGYLLDQFLRDGCNQRDDQYGGSIKDRCRIVVEVTEAVCSIWPSAQVGVRISPLVAHNDIRDSNPEALFTYLVSQINAYKIAYLYIMEKMPGSSEDPGPSFDTQILRRQFDGVYIVNGGYDRDRATAALEQRLADMVSLGTPFISNPDLVKRLARNAPLNELDFSTAHGGDERGLIDYPFMSD